MTDEFKSVAEGNEEIAEGSEEHGNAIGKGSEEVSDCVPERVPIVHGQIVTQERVIHIRKAIFEMLEHIGHILKFTLNL